MDAVRFGRWLADRRYARGWASQQALVDAVASARSPRDADMAGISRPFLARLEAGVLVHPFRGAARRRVVALAAFLCETPRQVQRYLQLAEITKPGPDESAQVERILAHVKGRDVPAPLLLPARPKRLMGRGDLVDELVTRIEALPSGCSALTGMPGIGKTALAAEALHLIAGRRTHRGGAFPDGIATFTCTGRRGLPGLLSLLEDIIATFAPTGQQPGTNQGASAANLAPPVGYPAGETDAGQLATLELALASATDRARAALRSLRVLLFLDDVEPSFPLRRALSVLTDGSRGIGDGLAAPDPGQVVLITSRTIPLPALVDFHLHLAPLEPDAALALLCALVAEPLCGNDAEAALRLCAAVGHVPLAIEVLASVVASRGVPLAWLADQTAHSLRTILDEAEQEMRRALETAIAAVSPDARHQFALLSVLGAPVFDLEAAGALRRADAAASPPLDLAEAAATMNQLVRQSVVDALPAHTPPGGCGDRLGADGLAPQPQAPGIRYTLNPLFAALAQEHASGLNPGEIERAVANLGEYALTYVQRYRCDVRALEPVGQLLLSATRHVVRHGDDDRIVRLINGLTLLIMRLPDERVGDRLYLHGVEAATRLNNFEHVAHFLNCLGNLRYYHGHIARAERTWRESIQAAEAYGRPGRTWLALYNLTLLERMRGNHVAAMQYTDAYYHSSEEGEWSFGIASSLLQRGISARLLGKPDAAYDDQARAVQIFNAGGARHLPGICRMLVLESELEFARLEGLYGRSMERMEEGIETAFETYDRYAAIELLLGQCEFASAQGAHDDAIALARRAREQSRQLRAPFFERRSANILDSLLRSHSHSHSHARAPHSA